MTKRVTTADFRRMKQEGQPIAMLTAYDYPTAMLVDASGIDAILVGDSLGNVVLGYDSTVPVTMDDIVHHLRAVTRGAKRAMVIGDLPFLSYHISREESVRNAGRLMQEGLAQAVKLEGGREVAETVRAITAAGIPVMGHLGLTPQSVHQLGGFKVQGKDGEAARKLLEDAKELNRPGLLPLFWSAFPNNWPGFLPKPYPFLPSELERAAVATDRSWSSRIYWAYFPILHRNLLSNMPI